MCAVDNVDRPLVLPTGDGAKTSVAWQREAFELARKPKKLFTLAGRHCDSNTLLLAKIRQAALDWFQVHLQ